jgi:hypothetical protein
MLPVDPKDIAPTVLVPAKGNFAMLAFDDSPVTMAYGERVLDIPPFCAKKLSTFWKK